MRHFYSYANMLGAAWMMVKHGMRFTDKHGLGVHPVFDAYSVKWYFDTTPEGAASAAYFGEVYFVHPESVELLEPIKGDLVFYDNLHGGEAWDEFRCIIPPDDERYPYVGTGEPLMLMDSGEHPFRKELRRIIQRDGTAFMWPEVEL